MFPTLSELMEYLTGLRVPLPLQTFGCVVALSFAAAYWAYRKELQRKEAQGWIQAVEKKIIPGRLSWHVMLFYALLAGWVIAKLVTAVAHYRSFTAHPSRILFSGVGNWPAGVGAALLVIIFLVYRRQKSKTQEPVLQLVHPYQMMDAMLWWCGVTGFIGAILFHKLEHLPELWRDPSQLFVIDGVTYYGGLLFGIATAMFMAWKRKIPLIHMLDMGSPAMMLAYGIGRMGCHLSGDGDWGIVNNTPLPGWLSFLPSWSWGYRYPGLTHPVFPTSLYESIVCIGLFLLLWQLRHLIKTPGRLFAIYCLLNGAERLFIEQIRVNPPVVFGFTQGALIASLFIVTGVLFMVFPTRQSPLRETLPRKNVYTPA
jgi:phosphatidylglycerol:prolipoprotein diacylglycerol transferase